MKDFLSCMTLCLSNSCYLSPLILRVWTEDAKVRWCENMMLFIKISSFSSSHPLSFYFDLNTSVLFFFPFPEGLGRDEAYTAKDAKTLR